jgi:predicted transcriptional regulator
MKTRPANRDIARMRRRTGLTQHQLSEETGIGVNRIVFFETGRLALLPDEVDRVRSVLRKHHRKNSAAMDAI